MNEEFPIYKKSHPGLQADFNATRDVGFYLYTQANPAVGQVITGTTASISGSNFNAVNPTRFIIHGYMNNNTSPVNTELTSAYLSRGNFNVVSCRIREWTKNSESDQKFTFIKDRRRLGTWSHRF